MDKGQASPELLEDERLPTQEEQAPAIPPTRKRQLDSDDAEPRTKRARAAQPASEPARLTRRNLARFNKMVNNNKGSNEVSTLCDSTTRSSRTKTISTTASRFAVQARENGILDTSGSKPPTNFEELHRRLAIKRTSAAPSPSVYEDYAYAIRTAPNEATIADTASRKLLKEYPSKGYKRVLNQAFTGYPKDVGFNNGLSAPQPDFIEGVEAEDYRPFSIGKNIPGAVLYSDNIRSIAFPHIAGEWKGPGANIAEAEVQAAYTGSAMVYGRRQALDAAKKADVAGHAKVTTFTSDGRNLNLFAHYAGATENGTLEYHQYPLKSLNLLDSYEGYKEGRTYLRNAQDLAREESYTLKDALKNYWSQPHGTLHLTSNEDAPLSAPGLQPLDTSHAVEADDGCEVVHQPTPPTSKHSQKRKASSSLEKASGPRRRSYWTKDASGRLYHTHADGAVSWFDDERG